MNTACVLIFLSPLQTNFAKWVGYTKAEFKFKVDFENIGSLIVDAEFCGSPWLDNLTA